MAYFTELSEDIQNDIVVHILNPLCDNEACREQAENCGMDFEDWQLETVDDWLNCHNRDLTNTDWLEQAKEANISY